MQAVRRVAFAAVVAFVLVSWLNPPMGPLRPQPSVLHADGRGRAQFYLLAVGLVVVAVTRLIGLVRQHRSGAE